MRKQSSQADRDSVVIESNYSIKHEGVVIILPKEKK